MILTFNFSILNCKRSYIKKTKQILLQHQFMKTITRVIFHVQSLFFSFRENWLGEPGPSAQQYPQTVRKIAFAPLNTYFKTSAVGKPLLTFSILLASWSYQCSSPWRQSQERKRSLPTVYFASGMSSPQTSRTSGKRRIKLYWKRGTFKSSNAVSSIWRNVPIWCIFLFLFISGHKSDSITG